MQHTYPCKVCFRPFTVQFFGVLGPGGSMVSSIPTDDTMRDHPDCFEMGWE